MTPNVLSMTQDRAKGIKFTDANLYAIQNLWGGAAHCSRETLGEIQSAAHGAILAEHRFDEPQADLCRNEVKRLMGETCQSLLESLMMEAEAIGKAVAEGDGSRAEQGLAICAAIHEIRAYTNQPDVMALGLEFCPFAAVLTGEYPQADKHAQFLALCAALK